MVSIRTASANFWWVLADRVIPLREGMLVMGRSTQADLCFPEDTLMSRLHARLTIEPGDVHVEDLGSQNGTWLDGARVFRRQLIWPGCVLRAGSTRLELQVVGPHGREDALPTAPDGTYSRVEEVAELTQVTTHPSVVMECGLVDACRALDEGRTAEARTILDEYLVLLDAAADRVSASLVDQSAALALRMAIKTGDGSYANQVSSTLRRVRRNVVAAEVRELAEAAARSGVEVDMSVFGTPRME